MFFMQGGLGYYVTWAGVILFSAVVVFQLVTVPVELDASRRAKKILPEIGMGSPQEQKAVSQVLNAAAWTYVAAAATSIATLLYFLLRLGLFSSDD